MENLPLFIVLALFAEILGTVGGFGSSMFFVPIASYFLDFYSVLGITAVFHISSNLVKIVFFRKGFDKKLVISIGLPAVLFVIAGAFLSKYIEIKMLEIFLALFLIVVGILLLVFKDFRLKATLGNSIGGGMFSGLIAGLLGTGGAIRGITLAAFDLDVDVFIATSAIIDLAIDSSRGLIYYFNGFIHRHDLYLIPILFLVSIAGTFTGKKILNRVSKQQFKSTVLILILLTGIITLSKLILKW